MEHNYTDLPQDLVNIEHMAVVEPQVEKKSATDKVFSYLYNHPILVLVGMIFSGLICVGVVAYFMIQKTTQETASIESLQPVSAKVHVTPKKRPVLNTIETENIAVIETSTPPPPTQTPQTITTPSITPQQNIQSSPMPSMAVSPTNTYIAPTVIVPTSAVGDTQPPFSIVMTPENNGSITQKTDGKVCAFMSPPSDNVSKSEDIEVIYSFDSLTEVRVKATNYLCTDSLANGAHTLKYRSKDAAGNEEADKVVNFTVNIADN
ncbi:MAG: hypothetical protein U0525_04210 [Patescibacteria group bacterium]